MSLGDAEGGRREPVRVAAVGAGAILLWSGTAVVNKVAVGHMDAMTAGVLRSMLAGFLGAGIAFAARLPRPATRRDRALLFLSGVASFAVWPMMLSLGLGRTTASHAALIMAILPVFTGLLGYLVERRRPRAGWWGGTAIAVLGTALLVSHRAGASSLASPGDLWGDLVLLTGTVVCAFGYVVGARLSPVIGTWATTFRGLAAALVVLVPGFVLLAPRTDWSSVGFAGWASIAYLAVLSSVVGYAAWFWALGHGGVSRVASWQFLQPVLTLGLAALLLGEELSLPLMLSAATILGGTALAQYYAR